LLVVVEEEVMRGAEPLVMAHLDPLAEVHLIMEQKVLHHITYTHLAEENQTLILYLQALLVQMVGQQILQGLLDMLEFILVEEAQAEEVMAQAERMEQQAA
jgi:hypothetical protein